MNHRNVQFWRGFLYMIFLITILITGCSNQSPIADETDVNDRIIQLAYWTPFSGGDNQFMTEMVERFNSEHTGIKVIQTNSRLDDYYSRLRTAILSGSAPDLAIVHSTNLPQFVLNGYIEDITEPAREVGLDWELFNANILQSTIYDERFYAVPLDTHALVMYYNKEFLSMANILDENEKPIIEAGQEGFVQFLKNIQQSVPKGIAPLAQPGTRIDSVWLWWSLYNQIDSGGNFYNDDTTFAVFNNAKALKALKFVNHLYQSELIPPNINDSFKMFYEGKAAVLITGMWGTGAFEQVQNLDFGVVPVPVIFDRPAVWGDSHALAIPTNHQLSPAKRKAALTFSKWMVEHGEMWAEAGHVPSMTQVLEGEGFQNLKYRSDYAATANYVSYWPRHVKQWTINELLIKEFEKMNYGQQSPEDALQAAVKQVNEELEKESQP
jgi:multiple sugar transport system substrate-binding protein